MKHLLFLAPFFFAPILIAADPPATPAPLASPAADASTAQAAREKAFGELLTGATLEGNFTSRDREGGKLPAPEKYTLGKVSKIKDDLWNFETRIQYGKTDVTIPLALRVVWSGDTPVITLDKVAIPGIGTFTCRVMFFDKQYAGMWDGGGNHGGLLFGKVLPAAAAKPLPEAKK